MKLDELVAYINSPRIEPTAEDMIETDEDIYFTPLQAIKAMKALLEGDYDNKQLMKLGALIIDDFENIKRILNCTHID